MSEQLLNRRESDKKRLDIEAMIAEENDPKQRSFLIILNSINNSLLANTSTTREVASKLDQHLTAFEQASIADAERRNRAAGMAKVATYVLSVVQVAGLSAVGYLYQDLRGMHQELTELRLADARADGRLHEQEEKLKTFEGKK